MLPLTRRMTWTPAVVLVVGPLWAKSAELGEPAEVFVRVEDRGNAVPGLKASNVRIVENGVGMDVARVEPAGPASVVLLVENSESSWKYLDEVNSAMQGFQKHAPTYHAYSLVSYSEDPKVEATLTKDAADVAAAYAGRKQSAWGYVAAYDALDRVLDEVEKLSGFRAVIMVGSGDDAFSRTSFKKLQQRVEAANVVIYTIQLGGSQAAAEDAPDLASGQMFLESMSRQSGGEFFCPNCEVGYKTAVEEILESLERFYRVSYARQAAPSSGFAKLRVEAFRIEDDERRDYRVVARPGWRF